MFKVTQHAGFVLARHLLDWAEAHTGRSAAAATRLAAEVEEVAVVAVEVVEVVGSEARAAALERWESAAAAQAGSGSIVELQRVAGSSCCSWWRGGRATTRTRRIAEARGKK